MKSLSKEEVYDYVPSTLGEKQPFSENAIFMPFFYRDSSEFNLLPSKLAIVTQLVFVGKDRTLVKFAFFDRK